MIQDLDHSNLGILEAAGSAVCITDLTGSITSWNQAAERLFGWTEQEVLGQPLRAVFGVPTQAGYQPLAAAGEAWTTEARVLHRNGNPLLIRVAHAPLRDSKGSVTGIIRISSSIADELAMQEALEASEHRFRSLVAHAADGIAVLDALGQISFISDSLCELLCVTASDVLGQPALDFLEPLDLNEMWYRDGGQGEPGGTVELMVQSADRKVIFEAVRTNLLDDPAVGGIVWNLHNVTDQHRAAAALAESERKYRSIVETAEEGICVFDQDGTIVFSNPKLAALLAYHEDNLEGRSLFDFISPTDHAMFASKLASRHFDSRDQYELIFLRADGLACHALIASSLTPTADDGSNNTLAMVTDITDRKRVERENARLTLEDLLTGLASRALAIDRINQVLAGQARHPSLAAVLILDLDDFKKINDSLGHSVGDEILCITAQRIRSAVRPQDTVARISGDEFVVVLEALDGVSDAVTAAQRLSDIMRSPFTIAGRELVVTASIGIALTPAADAESFVRDADIAMYQAKERGGACYELFDPSLRARAAARLEIEADLRNAIENEQFRVCYQPILKSDGHIVGFEALARWEHPTRGPIPPGEFIPVAEQTGLIVTLGAWVLDTACRDAALWRQFPGFSDLVMSVNLSGRQLSGSNFVGAVTTALRTHDLEPSALCLEITESLLMEDSVTVTNALGALSELGVTLAVDDFGTGYSSLLYLRHFPVAALKLDRFFVAGIEHNTKDAAIAKAVIDLAHSLDLYAVAEGVETAGQFDVLKKMGCDYAQGYYWCPAVEAADVETLLSQPILTPSTHHKVFAFSPTVLSDGSDPDRAETVAQNSVIIVDDSDGDRSLLFSHLETSGAFRVIGETGDGEIAALLAEKAKPDLVLLDMAMPGIDGLATIPLMLAASPLSQIVVLSGYVSSGLRSQALAAGAAAVLEKGMVYTSIVEELLEVISARRIPYEHSESEPPSGLLLS